MRFIIFIITFVFAYLLLKSVIRGLAGKKGNEPGRGQGRNSTTPVTDELVRDPACGVYVPKKEAVRARVRGTVHYFCSRECLEKFRSEDQNA